MAVNHTPHEAGRIYHICAADDWRAAERAGRYHGTALDRRDGFIHFSTAAQLPRTAARHFAGRRGLVVLEVEAAALGAALRWERSPDGETFPHLYGTLDAALVGAAHASSQRDSGSRGALIDRDRGGHAACDATCGGQDGRAGHRGPRT